MAITNLFKRYLEDKWPYGGGACVLLSMDHLVPVDIYFPEDATVTSVSIYDEEGNTRVITSSNYDRLYFDGRKIIGESDQAGPSSYVAFTPNDHPEATDPKTSSTNHQCFSSGYLIPMFVPSGWRLVKGLKGSIIGTICTNSDNWNGTVPDSNFPLKYLHYSAITTENGVANFNGVTKISCVCINTGTEPQTFSHIMLLASALSKSAMSPSSKERFISILGSSSDNDDPRSLKGAPQGSTSTNFQYRARLPLYYLDDDGVMHRLVRGNSGNNATTSYDSYNLFNDLYQNMPINEYLTAKNYAALPCVTPMIIEELSSPVTLAPGDAYTIRFELDLSNREAWVRNRSLPEEGLFYYSGSMTGQFPTA